MSLPWGVSTPPCGPEHRDMGRTWRDGTLAHGTEVLLPLTGAIHVQLCVYIYNHGIFKHIPFLVTIFGEMTICCLLQDDYIYIIICMHPQNTWNNHPKSASTWEDHTATGMPIYIYIYSRFIISSRSGNTRCNNSSKTKRCFVWVSDSGSNINHHQPPWGLPLEISENRNVDLLFVDLES